MIKWQLRRRNFWRSLHPELVTDDCRFANCEFAHACDMNILPYITGIKPMFSVNRRRLDITTPAIYIRQSKLLMTKWSHSHRICGCQTTIYILQSLMHCKIAANLFAVLAVLADILVVQPHQFGDISN